MNKRMLLITFTIAINILLFSCSPRFSAQPAPPQLLPMGGQESQQTPDLSNGDSKASSEEKQLKPILELGQRAITWLNLVNKDRNEQTRLNLADRTTKNPVPPEKPKVNSVKYLLQKLNERIASMPNDMKPYLLEGKTLVEVPPVSDEVFIKNIRELNSTYQSAVRLLGQIQWFDYYAQQDVRDIRGYYFFMKQPTAVTELTQFSKLADEVKVKYSEWLVGMCHNSGVTKSSCAAELTMATEKDQVSQFYAKYLPVAKNTYDSFFQATKIRPDLKWSPTGLNLTQDFILPTLQKITLWLKTNVEEEWKFSGFELLVNFVPQNSIAPFLVFEKGVTPHVSGKTWNSITMDPDYSLDDYDTQWTIRHEFGHVLGFRDCYLEFYDKSAKEMIYYTIEPDNLMCAWGGKLQQSHVDELKRVYK